ncbi:MAG TPA: glycosyltransferase family 2 protein [Thermoleophilaceae bacterium]
MARHRLSVVVVTYNCREDIVRTLPAVAEQLSEGDELVVVDNASSDGSAEVAAAHAAVLLRNERNEGFAAAANAGAARASGDLLVFLNPDAVPAPGFAEAIGSPLSEGRDWFAWMGLVTAEEGRIVNTSGGVVHFTGIAWAGEFGRPAAELAPEPREVGFASGACLAVPREHWLGFPEHYFMYCEDVDLSLRLRLAGGGVGLEPRARVDHSYEFAKGARKWRFLERNRWATVIRTYPLPLLLLVAPALLAAEPLIFAAAVAGGWWRQKLLAMLDVTVRLPRLLGERRRIQATRAVGSAEFAAALVPELSSPFLGRAAGLPLVGGLLRAYWRLVLLALR